LIVSWCGRFLFFVVPHQFSQDISEWPENQILIPDWVYFHCPGATLTRDNKKEKLSSPTNNQIYGVPANQISPYAGTSLVSLNIDSSKSN